MGSNPLLQPLERFNRYDVNSGMVLVAGNGNRVRPFPEGNQAGTKAKVDQLIVFPNG